ncbi:MAG TPA: hypothetical protein PLJ44_06120 [Victivallales bacterium]|nr:hypothetical protein [Victivallales bacterium]
MSFNLLPGLKRRKIDLKISSVDVSSNNGVLILRTDRKPGPLSLDIADESGPAYLIGRKHGTESNSPRILPFARVGEAEKDADLATIFS